MIARQYRVIFGTLLMLLAVLIGIVSADAAPQSVEKHFEQLKARYVTLRNTDPEIARAKEWETLADNFLRFAKSNGADFRAAAALMNAAILLEHLGQQRRDEPMLRQAATTYQAITAKYPKSIQADDALLRRADLLQFLLSSTAEADAVYAQLLDQYPSGDMAMIAQARRAALRGEQLVIPTRRRAPVPRTTPLITIAGRAPRVVIDPGHGGEDFGAVGVGDVYEKDIVLDVAFELERLLVEQLGAQVFLTRRTDVFIPLAERTALANARAADLFLSLHVNASPKRSLRGFEIYYLDNTDDQASHTLAERENTASQRSGSDADLAFMLSDLIQTGKLDDSVVLANSINLSVMDLLPRRWSGMKSLGVKRAPFFVLVGAHMPCALIEFGFVDHPEEGKKLSLPEFRRDLAQAVFLGVRNFLQR